MTTISKDADLITLINVFTVAASNQSRLVELLTEVTATFVRHACGFIASSLHRSRDGTKVAMYAQWRSLDDYEAMRRDPGPFPYLQEALTIATFEPAGPMKVESERLRSVIGLSRMSFHAVNHPIAITDMPLADPM